jgi:hypothetical protein
MMNEKDLLYVDNMIYDQDLLYVDDMIYDHDLLCDERFMMNDE